MRSELAFEWRNSFRVQLCAKTRESPVAIQAWEIGLPCCSLPEKLGSFGKFRGLGPHHTQVVIRTAEDFSNKRPILFCCWLFCGWRLGHRAGGANLAQHV